jgi:hypothetical protein
MHLWIDSFASRWSYSPMPQRPNAISLMLCDEVAFEPKTQKPDLRGVFIGIAVDSVPTPAQRFDIFAALTDGHGDVTMTFSVEHLDTQEVIYAQKLPVHFPHPLKVVNLRFRVRKLTFSAPGNYLFAISADDHEVAARRVRVYQRGDSK